MTSEAVEEQEVVLCIGDTTYLDYGKIKAKQEGYLRSCTIPKSFK
ncbi:MAG: hypothetical protein ACK48A_08640 [Pseudanabaena sp.]|jgi:hypothetical protein